MSLDKVVSSFVTSKTGQKFCKYISNPKNEKFVNSTLPVAQQALAEVTGVAITVFNPKMEKEQKKSQLINHGLKAGCNLTLVAAVSKGTATFAEKVAEGLKTKGISEGVQQGVKIGFPLLSACLLSRYLLPVLLNPISSKLRDKLNEKFEKKDNKETNLSNRKGYYEILSKNNDIVTWQNNIIKNKLDTTA